jgi:hypothetical protein
MNRSLGRFGRAVIVVGLFVFVASLMNGGLWNLPDRLSQDLGIPAFGEGKTACGEDLTGHSTPPAWLQDLNISVEELIIRKYTSPKVGSRCWTIDPAIRGAN